MYSYSHKKCCVPSCEKPVSDGRSFHEIPVNHHLRNKWLQNIFSQYGQSIKLPERASICSLHFEKSCFLETVSGKRKLKRNSVPTIFKNCSFSAGKSRSHTNTMKMEKKKFGVDISLLTQLKQFQLSLRRRRKTMTFLQMADVSMAGLPARRIEVQARDGRISLTPSAFIPGLKLPAQVIPQTADNTVTLIVDTNTGLYVTITFDEMDQKMHFINALGELNDDSDSSNGSSPSTPSSERDS